MREENNTGKEPNDLFFKVPREEVDSHLQDFMKIHLDLACMKLSDTEDELKKTKDKLNDTQETFTMKLETIQRRFETNTVMMKNESSVYPWRFLWKVGDFSKILREAKAAERKRIESDPFYTENYGYKLKLQIYPNGFGSAENICLSVFFVLMKGEYDALLKWPFQRKVGFTLIDQRNINDPEKQRNITKGMISSDIIGGYERPIVENEGRGLCNFISHKTLNSRRYLVDDTLYIQFEIGPTQNVTYYHSDFNLDSYSDSDESD